MSAESVRVEGLGFDECDVAVVTHVGAEHRTDLPDAETRDQLSVLMRCVVEAVTRRRGWAVLNADDPTTVAMAEYCRGEVIYFSLNPRSQFLAEHRAKGGRTATAAGQKLILSDGTKPLLEIPLPKPQTGAPTAALVENVLAAAGAAWALGLAADEIAAGLAQGAPQAVGA